MADRGKRGAAKQARRDARRRKARRGRIAAQEPLPEVPLIDEVREALDSGQPIDLLGLVSMVIEATAPKAAVLRRPDEEETLSLDELVGSFIDIKLPETTALLAVLGELLIDNDGLQDRCRSEVDARDDDLPQWLGELGQTSVRQAVRMSHVLGDGDELLLGVRLTDGQEMTCAVYIDHLTMSEVKDAFFVPSAIDAVLDVAKKSNDDQDTSFVEVGPADAKVELYKALYGPLAMFALEDSDTWPATRPLLRWLVRLMPEGGFIQRGSADSDEILTRFFASPVGKEFNGSRDRQLLEMCIDEGTGDPLRWSAPRLRQLLEEPIAEFDDIPAEDQLDVPDLLRAFIPFAHAESGIRQELTAEALAAIDEAADNYRVIVLEEAQEWERDENND